MDNGNMCDLDTSSDFMMSRLIKFYTFYMYTLVYLSYTRKKTTTKTAYQIAFFYKPQHFCRYSAPTFEDLQNTLLRKFENDC